MNIKVSSQRRALVETFKTSESNYYFMTIQLSSRYGRFVAAPPGRVHQLQRIHSISLSDARLVEVQKTLLTIYSRIVGRAGPTG